MSAGLRTLARILETDPPAVLSLDVFDTVLLRATRPELLRFRDIAARQDAALRDAGLASPGTETLYRARLVAHKAAYDRIRRVETGEVRHAEILTEVAAVVGLDTGTLPLLAAAEMETELAALRPNRDLLARVARRAVATRLVLVSDMYLSAADIRRLLERHAPALVSLPLYVSSQAGRSKRRGDLYPFVASSESTAPGAILPAFSAASIIAKPMRSFTLASGLKNSALPTRSATTPCFAESFDRRTSGVAPIVSRMLS